MSFCSICFFRRLHRSNQIHPGQQYPSSSDITTELEDSRKFSLNSLMALIAYIFAVPGSKALQPVVLTLLIYTISLRLAINTCFLHNYPTFSRFLHVVPLLGTSCMAGVALVSDLKSPNLAAVGISLGTLPLVTMAIHHGSQCGGTSVAVLPMQMQDVPTAAVLDVTETTDAST